MQSRKVRDSIRKHGAISDKLAMLLATPCVCRNVSRCLPGALTGSDLLVSNLYTGDDVRMYRVLIKKQR